MFEKNVATQIEYDNGVKIGKVKPLIAIGAGGVEKQKKILKDASVAIVPMAMELWSFQAATVTKAIFITTSFMARAK